MNPTSSIMAEPRLVLDVSGTDEWSNEPVLETPSDFFAVKYPKLTKAYGPAFLEAQWFNGDGFLHVQPMDINTDLFAAIIGGTNPESKVVFYQPESEWYGFNRQVQHFTIVQEEKLRFGLSQELIHCASYMSENRLNVRIGPLFQKFRSEQTLDSILERAKGLLTVDHSFFALGSGHAKDPARLTGEQTAKIFVLEALQSKAENILKLGEAYDRYVNFCQVKSLPVVHKNSFKEPTVLAIRQRFNLGFRNDLKLDGKYAHGWKGLEAAVPCQTALAA